MRISQLVLAGTILASTINCNAATVFNVSGIENLSWLELTSTVYMSRESVEAQLGAGGALEGWRYATRSEVETLYDAYWGGTTDGYSADNYTGARTFFDAFGVSTHYGSNGYDISGYSSWGTIFGDDYDCSVDLNSTCYGSVGIYDQAFGAISNLGYFHDEYGLSTGIDAINDQNILSVSSGYTNVGSHLVQVVPVPAAVWLFFTGLLTLFGFSNHRSKKENSY